MEVIKFFINFFNIKNAEVLVIVSSGSEMCMQTVEHLLSMKAVLPLHPEHYIPRQKKKNIIHRVQL